MELGRDILLEKVKTPEQQDTLKEHLVNVHLKGAELKEEM